MYIFELFNREEIRIFRIFPALSLSLPHALPPSLSPLLSFSLLSFSLLSSPKKDFCYQMFEKAKFWKLRYVNRMLDFLFEIRCFKNFDRKYFKTNPQKEQQGEVLAISFNFRFNKIILMTSLKSLIVIFSLWIRIKYFIMQYFYYTTIAHTYSKLICKSMENNFK